MKRLFKYFANGLLFLIPLAVTIWIIYKIFTTVDNTVLSIISGRESSDQPGWWRTGSGHGHWGKNVGVLLLEAAAQQHARSPRQGSEWEGLSPWRSRRFARPFRPFLSNKRAWQTSCAVAPRAPLYA